MRRLHTQDERAHEGKACRVMAGGGGAEGGAYCTRSSSKLSSTACFLGRPRCTWRPRLNSSSSTVQKDPKSSSTLTKHLCRDRLVRTAPWKWGGVGKQTDTDAATADRQKDRQRDEMDVWISTSDWGLRCKHSQHITLKLAGEQWAAHSQWNGAHQSTPRDTGLVSQAMRGWGRDTYPLIFCGLLFWNSSSSTVHTAPLTFSTRTKHLWRLRLCRTAFCSWCKRKRKSYECKRKCATICLQIN